VGVRRFGAALLDRGLVPVLAHPERAPGLAREERRAEGWRAAGWRLQLNLLSLVGRHGAEAQRVAASLLAEGLYDFAGSDLHRPGDLDALRRAHAACLERMPEAAGK
jgi:tyrosine-protein phosphatase YwqE